MGRRDEVEAIEITNLHNHDNDWGYIEKGASARIEALFRSIDIADGDDGAQRSYDICICTAHARQRLRNRLET